jgi:hypothetical protein
LWEVHETGGLRDLIDLADCGRRDRFPSELFSNALQASGHLGGVIGLTTLLTHLRLDRY